jgi:hypothetical protein
MVQSSNRLCAHIVRYQPYRLEDALEGIAAAGCREGESELSENRHGLLGVTSKLRTERQLLLSPSQTIRRVGLQKSVLIRSLAP